MFSFAYYYHGTISQFGYYGEKMLRDHFTSLGYMVSHRKHMGDLILTHPITGEIKKIEVKSARKGKDGKYRATLIKTGCTDVRDSDVLILLVAKKVDDTDIYIIPVKDIFNRRHIVITSDNYHGRFAQYKNAWEHIS